MNIYDQHTIDLLKLSGARTENERVLLEALKEAEATRAALEPVFKALTYSNDIQPDLERTKETLAELRELADKEGNDWFKDANTPAPLLTSTDKPERLAAVCLKVSDLFNESVMDFVGLEALDVAGEVYQTVKKAYLES